MEDVVVTNPGPAVDRPRVAVIVPCHNEEASIGLVVDGFRSALPGARIHVYDNASTDRTSMVAAEHGAVVAGCGRKGKGNVVRKMFADVDADIYVMVDGDATYDPAPVGQMIDLLLDRGLDMVVGRRIPADRSGEEYRSGHVLGNQAFTALYNRIFRLRFDDVFSGYRVMTRRFVKSFPATTSGFDIETELIVHAADLQIEVAEVDTDYFARLDGSDSKLSTYRDGWRILRSATRLYRDAAPQRFFGVLAGAFTLLAWVLGVPVINEFLRTGLVPRFPTAFLALGLQIIGLVLLTAGIVVSSVRQISREQRRLTYVSIPPPTRGQGPA